MGVPKKYLHAIGVQGFLGYLVGGTKIPRIFGGGVLQYLAHRGGAKYPRGVRYILGYIEWGCQISWDAKYTVTPDLGKPSVWDFFRKLSLMHG